MSEIDPTNYMDYEEEDEEKGKRRERKRQRRKRPHTFTGSDKQQHRQDITSVRKDRGEAAEALIGQLLETFPDPQSDEGLSQARVYIRWVKDALLQDELTLPMDEVVFKNTLSSKKAGGQHLQKNRTAVVATHLPTCIKVRNEEERSAVQNRENAISLLTEELEDHLGLWKTLLGVEPQVDVNKKVLSILKKQAT